MSLSPRLYSIQRLQTDAVVIGGGIAGLLAAHVLTKHLDRVILVEKDDVETGRIAREAFDEVSVNVSFGCIR